MCEDATARQRIQELVMELLASPTLPALGWTKTVETIVASGPTVNWTAYSLVVSLLWAYAYDIYDTTEAAVEAADGTLDELSDSREEEDKDGRSSGENR